MRIILFIIALLNFHFQSIACMGANQYRIFPLGTINENIIAVAVKIDRGHISYILPAERAKLLEKTNDERMDFSENITAIISLIEINEQQIIRSEKRLDTFRFLPPKEMDIQLTKKIQFLLDSLQKSKGFKALETESLQFCNFKKECKLAKIEFQKKKNSLQIRFQNNQIHPVIPPQDTTLIIHPFYEYIKERTEDANEEGAVQYDFSINLYINSVRYYKQGKTRWVVLHITQGELVYDYENEQVVKNYPYNEGIDMSFPNIRNSYFYEPLLYHANGYDWIIRLKD